MQVIPAINAPDFKVAEGLIKTAGGFSEWIHIDVGDGKFSSVKTWGNPNEVSGLKLESLNTEIHLMVVDPVNHVEDWLKAGAKRLIVHMETLGDENAEKEVSQLILICRQKNADLMLSINPETPVEKLRPFFNKINYFQILAVIPGKAGQGFQSSILEKIKTLRQEAPNAKIEVDGGINPETAELVKKVGADIVVSASYVFGSEDPKRAYRELVNI